MAVKSNQELHWIVKNSRYSLDGGADLFVHKLCTKHHLKSCMKMKQLKKSDLTAKK